MKKYLKKIIIAILLIIVIISLILLFLELDNNKKLEHKYKSINNTIIYISENLKKNNDDVVKVSANINTLRENNIERIKVLEKWKRQNQKLKDLLG